MTTTITHLEAPPTNRAWLDSALCAQSDSEVFFPKKGGRSAAAKRICDRCPSKTPCLAYALEKDERFGIWGGLSRQERERLKKGSPEQPPARRRSRFDDQRAQRDSTIVEMTAQGSSAVKIAEQLGITDRTVHRVLARHRARTESSIDVREQSA